jgi:hypothetical protein
VRALQIDNVDSAEQACSGSFCIEECILQSVRQEAPPRIAVFGLPQWCSSAVVLSYHSPHVRCIGVATSRETQMHDLSRTLVCRRGRGAAAKPTIFHLLAISSSVMSQCHNRDDKCALVLCAAEQVARFVQRRSCIFCRSSAECVLRVEVVKAGRCIITICQLAMDRQNDIRCTAGWQFVRQCAPGRTVAPACTAMLLLLLTILLAAGGALADVITCNTVPRTEGQSALTAAYLRPQGRKARALLVIGGRNDPEVL